MRIKYESYYKNEHGETRTHHGVLSERDLIAAIIAKDGIKTIDGEPVDFWHAVITEAKR